MKTSEYVALGHPDKTADAIGSYILDRLLEQDPKTRCGLEVQFKNNRVCLAGEITTKANVEYAKWVKEAIEKVGYTKEYCTIWGEENVTNPDKLNVIVEITQQSPNIKQGVDMDGWGDQGCYHGMATACRAYGYMPYDYFLAKDLGQKLYEHAKENIELGLGIDIKTQVTIDEKDIPTAIVVAIPMLTDSSRVLAERFVKSWMVSQRERVATENIIINGTGTYIKHGAVADAGVLGRKLAVDAYGGNCIIGGGCPWGKDATKSDLTLNMYARKIALDASAAFGETCYVELSTVIGQSAVSVTLRNSKREPLYNDQEMIKPNTLMKQFELSRPIFYALNENGLYSTIK